MSIDTIMLLATTTALQCGFEGWGQATTTGVYDVAENYVCDANAPRGAALAQYGRMISVLPYIASPAIINLFSKTLSNHHYFSIGLALLNLVPVGMYMAKSDHAEQVSKIIGVAMKVLNVVVMGSLISTASAPMGVAALGAITACLAGSAYFAKFTMCGFPKEKVDIE